jgi:hypothetical protein
MQRVINFSGGKTSALMTILYYQPGDIVLFTDTGREHPKTYKFINDFEAFENIPITRISWHDKKDPFTSMLSSKKWKIIPNRHRRVCTVELKVRTARRYLRSIGLIRYENLIGFRYDEQQRIKDHVTRWKKVVTLFPLNDARIDKAIVNEYWSKKPYTLEIPSILGNCTLCFMKGKNAIISILTSYPDLAEPWIADENRAKGRTYFKDITIAQLRSIAKNNLFKDYDLSEVGAAFSCACTT